MHEAFADEIAALATDFPRWHIWRSRGSSGTETDWNATCKGRGQRGVPGMLSRLTAASPASLRALLGQQETLSHELELVA
jgi:hypothetical protein